MAKAASVELHGKDDLKRAFKDLSAMTRRGVIEITRESADEIKREARARIRVDTGVSQGKIEKKSTDGGLGAEVGGTWFKLRFLEHGTVKMHARPFLYPAFAAVRNKYIERLRAAIYGVTRGAA